MEALDRWNTLVRRYVDYTDTRLPRGAAAALPPAVLDLRKRTRDIGWNFRRISYEGAFLYACAEFEQVIRESFREFGRNLSAVKPVYLDLPIALRKRLESRGAEVLTKIRRDQYDYLLFDDVVARLHSSVRQSVAPVPSPYDVVQESLSHTDYNMKWSVLRELLEGVGCRKVDGLICSYSFVRSSVGARTKRAAMSALPTKLTDLMQKRNRIIHRSHAAFIPSDADVDECVRVFSATARAIFRILEDRLNTL